MRTLICSAVASKWIFGLCACLILAINASAVAAADDAGAPVAVEKQDPPPDSSQATHRQVSRIAFGGKVKLVSFCLTPDGHIVAALKPGDAAPQENGTGLGEALASLFSGKQKKPQPAAEPAAEPPLDAPSEIRLLDPQGKLLKRWPVKFEVQTVNVDRRGQIFAAGDGQLASFDQDGKLLNSSEAPPMPLLRKNPDALREQAKEEIESRKTDMLDAIKNAEADLEGQLKQYAGKSDKELTADEREEKQQAEATLQLFRSERLRLPKTPQETVEQVMGRILARHKRINALAASDQFVFITCGAPKGYGYAVWRVDRKFENPRMIVKSLSGCCGQMDVQCDGDELVVAENSRHRVVRYSAEGQQISSFGKRSRDGQLECFGGCCNPMNVQARGDRLYVSESDGQVKLFRKDGTFLELVGVAEVKPGCKSSSIGVAADGQRVYYIDVNNSAILVLEPKAAALSATK